MQTKEAERMMQASIEDRRLLNVLEIKMYDIAQNVEIIGKQLTSNQIKDVVASTYNIFCQLRRIFENTGAKHLYQIVRKMQVNSIVLTSILTERIDKKATDIIKPKNSETVAVVVPNEPKTEAGQATHRKVGPAKLGGINLYNQSYTRGLEYYEVTEADSLEQMAGKCRVKQSKKMREQFLESITRELDLKAEVEMENISDEIKKYIKDYKENSKINSYISYEKELVQIIDFFKVSELEAMSFLNKSPNNQDYTEDFINRMNDIEHDFKVKEKVEKNSINSKLRDFILNLKEKIHLTEQRYVEKATKLALYEKSLKKETICVSTQTYDGYQSRLKEQEQIIKELEERYKILTEIKNKQLSFESRYYDAHHELNIKISEINKIKTLNLEFHDQIQYLKKIIRDNKEKINIDLKQIDKRKKNKKYNKQPSKKEIEPAEEKKRDSLMSKQEVEMERRASKIDKKTRRIQRVASQNSTYLKSVELSEIQKQISNEPFPQQTNETPKKGSYPMPPSKQAEAKESFFKNQFKKNWKKMSDEERKVSFIEEGTTEKRLLTQKSQLNEVVPDDLSIDNIKDEQNEIDNAPKGSRRNFLRQVLDSNGYSVRSFDESKKSSKSISKKCIILKDHKQKQKNLLATTIKLEHLTINGVINLTILPHIQYQPAQQISKLTQPAFPRRQRPSYPFANSNAQQHSSSSINANYNLSDIAPQIINKVKSTNISIAGKEKLKTIDNSQKYSLIDMVKRQEIRRNIDFITSKKQNQSELPSSLKQSLSKQGNSSAEELNLKKAQRPKAHLDKHRRDIAAYLDSLNKGRNASEESVYQKWRGNSVDNSDTNSLADYIVNELSKQDLNITEFKEIACLIEAEKSAELGELHPYKKENKQIVPLFKEFQSKAVGKQKSRAKKKQNRQPRQIGEAKNAKYDDIYGIGEHIYLKVRDLHKRISKCTTNDNHPCEHLTKYLHIIKSVDDIRNQKRSLKMHIEKIGQAQTEVLKSCKRSLEELRSVEKQNPANKLNYIKAHLPTMDQLMEQGRENILPVISTASSTYYKPKNKHFAFK